MPRKGHKEGCQCVVCKALRAQAARAEPVVIAEPEPGVAFREIKVGEQFEYPIRWGSHHYWRKRSGNITTGEGTATDLSSSGVGTDADLIKFDPHLRVMPCGKK